MYEILKPNPKTDGSGIIACRPQIGICPNTCNQCFYNRPEAFYCDILEPYIPSPVDKSGLPIEDIVRMNDGHDSNIQKDLVIETAQKYKHYFFNTSIPKLDFPGPVVLTVNPKEEEAPVLPQDIVFKGTSGPKDIVEYYKQLKEGLPSNIMYVRLRVSTTNLNHIEQAVSEWSQNGIPVVLTFMAYYEETALPSMILPTDDTDADNVGICYTWKQRHINSYYCPTRNYMAYVLKRMKKVGGRLVTMCGTLDSPWCRDCGNCKRYYQETMKHLREVD